MADDDVLNDDPESGADDEPCATSNLQAFLERYGMLAIIVYGCISLGMFCAIYAALVFGADAGPVLRYFGFSEAASEGTTFIGDRPHKVVSTDQAPDRGLHRRAHFEGEGAAAAARRCRVKGTARRRLLVDATALFEELGEDELEKEEARAAAAPAAIHVCALQSLCSL